jgi:hypothetical protein
MLGDQRIRGDPMLTQCLRCARLVLAHQPRVARHIGGEDRGSNILTSPENGKVYLPAFPGFRESV